MKIALRVDKLANNAVIARARVKLEENINRAFRRQVYKMFEDAVLVSPQFSGEYAANWRISLSDAQESPVTWSNKTVPWKKTPHVQQAGDLAAFAFARERMERIPFTYKDKVYFVNDSPLTMTTKTVTDAKGVTRDLRPENLVISHYASIFSYLRAKYK